MPKIAFNGQEYDSVETMPAEVRQLYELATNILSATSKGDISDAIQHAKATVMSTSQFIVDGKAYSSLDELPPDARKRYEQTMQSFDTNQNGIPDMLEGAGFGIAAKPQPPVAAATHSTPTQPPLVTVVGEGRSLPASLAIALMVIVLLIGLIGFLLLNR